MGACKSLESNARVPRSFQILIPRVLPALYEIRNNRGVGRVGGDVDPNHMDATFVLSCCNWEMAELVRVMHSLEVPQAQSLVDSTVERRIPLVWHGSAMKRVLNPEVKAPDQILLLLASSGTKVRFKDLQLWTGYKNVTRFSKLIRSMHDQRLVEFSEAEGVVEILPPGSAIVSEIAGSAVAI